MSVIELQAPLVLAGDMSTSLASIAVLDVVINNATVDERALLFLFVSVAVPLARATSSDRASKWRVCNVPRKFEENVIDGVLPGSRAPVHAAGPASHHHAKLGQVSSSAGNCTVLPSRSVATILYRSSQR